MSGVVADGAAGQRQLAVVEQAAAVPIAELPLTVQSVSVAVPLSRWPGRRRHA